MNAEQMKTSAAYSLLHELREYEQTYIMGELVELSLLTDYITREITEDIREAIQSALQGDNKLIDELYINEIKAMM
jgi:hypothetical protein